MRSSPEPWLRAPGRFRNSPQTAHFHRSVRLHKWPSLTPLATLRYHAEPVATVAYGSDGTILTASRDGRLALWRAYATVSADPSGN